MDHRLERLEQIRRSGQPAVAATLVATRGTAPRKEGARMWVGADGAILGSVTIGGCVDAEVIRAAEAALKDGATRLISMDLGDEDAHALGLTCAGAIDLLVEVVDASAAASPIMNQLRDHVARGGRAVLVTPLPAEEPVDGVGGPFVVFDDGKTAGSLGTPELDAEAARRAADRLRAGSSRTEQLAVADRALDAFFEVFGPGALLSIVGAGTIAEALSQMGRMLGMRVVIIDGRARFASEQRFPDAEVRVGVPSEEVAALRPGPDAAIVVVAHDYKFDVPVLKAALATEAGYIGMLGSRRRGGAILDMLEAEGVGRETLARIRTPIGLDIGAQSAEEIAVAIVAEILAVRSGRSGASMASRTA